MAQSALKCVFAACTDVAEEHDMASLKGHMAKEHLDYAPHTCANCNAASYDRMEMMEHGEADGHAINFGKAHDATCERLLRKYCREATEATAPQTLMDPVLRAGSKRRCPAEPSPATIIPAGLRRVPDADLSAQRTWSGYTAFVKANKELTRAEIRRRGLPLSAWGTIPGKWWRDLTKEERQAWGSNVQQGTKAKPPREEEHREELDQESTDSDKIPFPIDILDCAEAETGEIEGNTFTQKSGNPQRDQAVEGGKDDYKGAKALSFFCCPHDTTTFD